MMRLITILTSAYPVTNGYKDNLCNTPFRLQNRANIEQIWSMHKA